MCIGRASFFILVNAIIQVGRLLTGPLGESPGFQPSLE